MQNSQSLEIPTSDTFARHADIFVPKVKQVHRFGYEVGALDLKPFAKPPPDDRDAAIKAVVPFSIRILAIAGLRGRLASIAG